MDNWATIAVLRYDSPAVVRPQFHAEELPHTDFFGALGLGLLFLLAITTMLAEGTTTTFSESSL